jgi:hypothetical protein
MSFGFSPASLGVAETQRLKRQKPEPLTFKTCWLALRFPELDQSGNQSKMFIF